MRIVKGIFVTLLTVLAASAAASFAQMGEGVRNHPGIQDPPRCPTITVSCPDTPGPDGSLVFTANVTGGDPNVTPTFKWTASSGAISSGQGTSSITLNTEGKSYSNWTATVEVSGYDHSCLTASSCSLFICPPPQSREIDEYGDIPVGEEKLRLDNIAVELRNDPISQLYLICYGGRRGEPRAAARRCMLAKKYLVGRGINSDRVVTSVGGRRESPTVEAWFVPSGAAPPQPSPTVFPHGHGRR